ncbi:MAG: adenylate/guanylate cyclase domain-containing protein [Deltaproteobacteria bacterium]|nr:adenylate/guanylate cyclase domain-containing protein [Deltaproteobacteria bacterium]
MTEKNYKRKLSAILSADAAEYSRLMEDDEEATVRTLTTYREVMRVLIRQHNGNVIDTTGDNLLAEFASVVEAVQCAVAIQREIKSRNANLLEKRRMPFRMGINLGDVIQEQEHIYGDGVNIAARLEGLSDPGGICISKTAFDHIESKLPYGYEFMGNQTVKNIARPVGAYRVLLEPQPAEKGAPRPGVPAGGQGAASPTKRRPVPGKTLGNAGDYYAGGVVCIACALGLPVFGFFIEKVGPGTFYPMVGAGALVGIIGLGLIVWGKMIDTR